MIDRYVIFCDESTRRGSHFSNFYGGVLVPEPHLDRVNEVLQARKIELNLLQEVKFTKISEHYQNKYISLMDTFFALIAAGDLKVRINFTQNIHYAVLTEEQRDNSYFLLYYQFVKHAFGLQHAPGNADIALRLNFDWFPEKLERIAEFRRYLSQLSNHSPFIERRVFVKPEDIVEVDSKKHAVLQCLDVVLGAMQFRLNDNHLYREPGVRAIPKRTKAKLMVYKHIHKRICELYPGYQFNIGTNTNGSPANFNWSAPYRHWRFVPRNHTVNEDYEPKR